MLVGSVPGSYCQYALVPEEWCARVPTTALPLATAGAVPLVGLTAWQALMGAAPHLGQRCLVLAASGGEPYTQGAGRSVVTSDTWVNAAWCGLIQEVSWEPHNRSLYQIQLSVLMRLFTINTHTASLACDPDSLTQAESRDEYDGEGRDIVTSDTSI